MVRRASGDAGLPITYFDLFVHGLVNIGRSLYYGMALVTDVAEIKLDLAHSEFGLGMGGEEHDFLWSYVCFLVEQHLADVNMSDAFRCKSDVRRKSARSWSVARFGRFVGVRREMKGSRFASGGR
jgi:hypothetical protein